MSELVDASVTRLWEVDWEEGYGESCYFCQLEADTLVDCEALFKFLCKKRGWNPRWVTVKYEDRGDLIYSYKSDKGWDDVLDRLIRHRADALALTLKLQEERNKIDELQKSLSETTFKVSQLQKQQRIRNDYEG